MAERKDWVKGPRGLQKPTIAQDIDGLCSFYHGESTLNESHQAWQDLQREFGPDACRAVQEAFMERQEHNASGNYSTSYVWDYQQQCKLTPAQIISHMDRMVAHDEDCHTFFDFRVKLMGPYAPTMTVAIKLRRSHTVLCALSCY
jgi:hypothetical protein